MLLDGMKIVSFCHFLQGPAAMQYLGDMGAEVIRIEPPHGSYERHWAGAGARVGGVSSLYLCANRNARSIAIDLKKPGAKEIVMALIESSHAVAENFRPGTLDRLGLGFAAVKAQKPDIIYASASGFGATGPYAQRPGQDLLIQAMSGIVSANGAGAHRPTAIGCAAADQHGAALFALGIAGAYARWLRTGEGTHVEASLLGAGIDLQAESLVAYYASGEGRRGVRPRRAARHLVPPGALWHLPDRRRAYRAVAQSGGEARPRAGDGCLRPLRRRRSVCEPRRHRRDRGHRAGGPAIRGAGGCLRCRADVVRPRRQFRRFGQEPASAAQRGFLGLRGERRDRAPRQSSQPL